MGMKQKEWARKTRQALLAELGGECARCGTTEALEFDCIIPCGDAHHKFDTSARMSFYRHQYAAGNLQVLCHECNGIKGKTSDLTYLAAQPF